MISSTVTSTFNDQQKPAPGPNLSQRRLLFFILVLKVTSWRRPTRQRRRVLSPDASKPWSPNRVSQANLLHHLHAAASRQTVTPAQPHKSALPAASSTERCAHTNLTFGGNQRDACTFPSGLHHNLKWRLTELAITSRLSATPLADNHGRPPSLLRKCNATRSLGAYRSLFAFAGPLLSSSG